MRTNFNPEANFNETRRQLGYTPRKQTPAKTYEELGFMCGLEVHQQLKTDKKLFCNCPAGVFQRQGNYEAEIIRHMRPTLSEMGGYDGTALMEFKTKKTVVYRIANVTTCTYDVDDTPPFKVNRQALNIALEVALLLKTNIVGELHITRKQYLDGSIPTGFQRTGIISIEGSIPLKHKTIRIIQLSMEEDSCREVSDIGHVRVYTTDRLGMPLIETVTYPDMKTPEEAAEAAHYIRFLNRSTGKVRTGMGAAREDVNVSITGGTRVEIKGVSHISYIPELVHNEAFRQKSLLEIKWILDSRIHDQQNWHIGHKDIDTKRLRHVSKPVTEFINNGYRLIAVNLPAFNGLLSYFTQPNRMFADEISDRLKVIACIEKPNMTHSEDFRAAGYGIDFDDLRAILKSATEDAQILLWGPESDLQTALETIEERCKLAFQGVPNETRKSFSDGTTIFERVLPGADRMYPDTDSAPISISQDLIDGIQAQLPIDVNKRMQQLLDWKVPEDAWQYLLRNNLVPLLERIEAQLGFSPKFAATLLAHRLKNLQGSLQSASVFDYERIYEMFAFAKSNNLNQEILYEMLPHVYSHPKMELTSVLEAVNHSRCNLEDLKQLIHFLHGKFPMIKTSKHQRAEFNWMMRELRKTAIGSIPMSEVAQLACKEGKLS